MWEIAVGSALLAASGSGGNNTIIDPSNPAFWASLGLFGVGMIAFIKGWVVPGYVLDRAEQRIKDQDATIEKLTDVFQKEVIPSLNRSTEANESVFNYLVSVKGPTPRPVRKRPSP